MNALDIFSQLLVNLPPKDLPSAAFSMRCLSESFEKVVEEHYGDLAFAMFNSACQLYEALSSDSAPRDDGRIIHPHRIGITFKKFENIYLTLNELYPEFSRNNWQAQLSWRNIQDLYKGLRYVLIRNPRFAAA